MSEEDNKPREYDINLASERARLLRELSGYLGPDMDCRKAFLECGTDFEGRKFAIEGLDALRRQRGRF